MAGLEAKFRREFSFKDVELGGGAGMGGAGTGGGGVGEDPYGGGGGAGGGTGGGVWPGGRDYLDF
jgi:DNA-directed RNA polymerase II subunit RPB11